MSKKNAGLEFIEDPDALAGRLEKAEDFFEMNRNLIFGVVGALVLAVAGYFAYQYFQGEKNTEGQDKLFNAVYKFEQDSLQLALNGKGAMPGLLAVADDYSGTKAGNLAHFYAGTALLKEGKFDQAIEQLKDFSSSDLLVQARAYALIGDAYSEKKSYAEAAEYYEKAAEYKPNKFFSPGYLLKLAIAQENAKANDKAIDAYQQILDKYPETAEAVSAKKYKSVLEAQSGE
ncbi:tetratricopeptide repeat protein [Fibrella sp. ES10-3-2-2]|nr:cytochrome C biosynthesis protein [Fibrella sp. ES10-3-2-2]